jgi:rod shape-determining protein MreC
VITPQGIVGKINKVFSGTAQILQINDATAGAGVMLERSRLRGVLHGTASGIPEILHIMADEKIQRGDPVVTSGGDQIYPRGLPIGTVFTTGPDPEGGPFMVVRVKPSANLDKVEEVLVITKIIDQEPTPQETTTTLRAADVLAQRLPTVTPRPPSKQGEEPPPTSALYSRRPASPQSGNASAPKPGTGERTTSQTTIPKTTAPTTATPKKNTDKGASPAESAPTDQAAQPAKPKAPKPETRPPDRKPQENSE